jgi:mannose-6-phosphate isomerase-like protein (cupin superfamily)
MKRFINFVIMPVIILGLLILPPAPAFQGRGAVLAAGGPRAEIPQTVHDFGEIWDYQEVNHTFTIKNTGDAPLEILEVDPDCACTVANYTRSIPPGGEGKITLGLKPFSVSSPFQKNTDIRLNDPSRGKVTLVMKGVGKPSVEILPGHVIRFRGGLKEEHKAQVRFVSHLPTHWEITRFTTDLGDKVEVSLKPEQPGKSYVLEVHHKIKDSGHYTGKIELFTNNRTRPKIVVRVISDLYPDSAVNP